ncbi:MAG TPA: TetR/AcrR family transcriptional regulator [Mycobacteriales bacterium]|jgi:AcrR family transcriptional regulator|nr:TetR/AcrR family transcriptional regulator [Mycobacteriales bacterium]
MTGKALTRRTSYGPNSPVVGQRGARTRQRLLDIALRLFADNGFHATLVDDIAREAGVSRATFYQYFNSRDQVVVELVEECGAELMRVVRRLGPLSATATGYDNVHWWLGEWAYVYDKYATIFVEWAHIDGPETPLRPMIVRFVENYTSQLAGRLSDATFAGLEPSAIALALQTMIERFNYYRLTQQTGASDREMLDTLAICVQRLLFPATPGSAYINTAESPIPAVSRLPLADRRSAGPDTADEFDRARFATMSEAGRASIEQLVAAGARVFAESGYRGSSVDQILAMAGLSRRTFYKYFDNRFDLLLMVSDRCAAHVADLAAAFPAISRSSQIEIAVSAWVESVVRFANDDGGILRIWLEEPVSPQLKATADRAIGSLIEVFETGLSQSLPLPGFSPTAAAWVLLSVVERVPRQAVATRDDLTTEQLVDLMTGVITRGLL